MLLGFFIVCLSEEGIAQIENNGYMA